MAISAHRTAPRRARLWRLAFSALLALCAAAFAANMAFSEVEAGNTWSLAYGIVATVLMVAAAAYGLRRRAMRAVSRLHLGSARAWLWFHVYGGLLFLFLVLMHSGFRLPTGALNAWTWALALWTVASGLLGLGLQQWIPRVLASGLSVEANYDRIPELIDEIRAKAEELVASAPYSLRELYHRTIRRDLAAPQRRLAFFFDITGGIRFRLRDLDYLRGFLSGEEKEQAERLEALYRGKLEIDAHYTLQLALRLWLWLHVPTSMLLVALVALHIFTVVYY